MTGTVGEDVQSGQEGLQGCRDATSHLMVASLQLLTGLELMTSRLSEPVIDLLPDEKPGQLQKHLVNRSVALNQSDATFILDYSK